MSGLTMKVGKKSQSWSSASTSGGVIAGAPALPQVNLLPVAVRQRRALKRVKGWLAVAVAAVLVAILGGYVVSMFAANAAEDELATTQAESQRLLQEQAKYAEVPLVLGQIADAQAAEKIGMGHEILWVDYLRQVVESLPESAKLGSFVSVTVTPTETAPMPTDQLLNPGIGTVTLAHRSPTLPDISAWIDALGKIEGFADVNVTVAQTAEDDGDVYYEVTSTVQVMNEALSGRYLGEGSAK